MHHSDRGSGDSLSPATRVPTCTPFIQKNVRLTAVSCKPVSYTHLDVYKRQVHITTHRHTTTRTEN